MKAQTDEADQKGGAPAPGVILIRAFQATTVGDHREISAEVDGDRVSFRAPVHCNIVCRAEPFLGIALVAAMARTVDIHIDDSMPVSEKLYRALPEFQSIRACWNTDLRSISVHARTQPSEEVYEKVGSFYSGGVDGSFTLCRNLADITHLIMLRGLENAGNTAESWRKGLERNTAFAHSIRKEFVPIDTNVREWFNKRRIAWDAVHGSVLASLGSLLRMKRLYIASDHTYNELFPWGNHPLTDPMWSTESTTVIHDGAAFRRGEKMKEICKHEQILNNLKSCWYSIHDNCGKCPKCIRTMTALLLLGTSTPAFPDLKYNPGVLKTFQAREKSAASFLEDALILAKEAKHADIERVLGRYHRMHQIRQLAKMVDRYLLSGIMRRTYRACAKPRRPGRSKWLVEVKAADDWDV